MPKKRIIMSIVALLFGVVASAQSCYNDNRNDGLKFKQRGDFQKAIRCFKVAKSCPDKPRKNDLDAQIASCRKSMTSTSKPKPVAVKPAVKAKMEVTHLAIDGNTDDIDLEATAEGGYKVFDVDSPSGGYDIYTDVDWCHVTQKNSKMFRVEVSANSVPRARAGKLLLKSGKEVIGVFVTQDPAIPAWNPNGSTLKPTGTAAEMPDFVSTLKTKGNYRLAGITSNRRGILVSDNCQYFCTQEVPQPLSDKMKQIQQHGDRLNSITITGSGYYCITWDKNSWFGKVTDAMRNKIRDFVTKGDELLNVSIADDGNFTILTDRHVYASRQSDLNLIKKAETMYGDSKCITITTKGICVVCEYGILYSNVPVQLANRLKEIGKHPDFVTYTDSGTYFMSDDNGWYDYSIR